MLFAFATSLLTKFGLSDALAKRFAWVPIAIIALFIAWLFYFTVTSLFDKSLDTAKEAGATGAVLQGQNQTLDQLKDANDAETKLRTDGPRSAIAYAECLRNNRNYPACERYNPDAGQ